MNFLEIPSCYDCIVKIKYGSTFSYLKMNLKDLRNMRSKFRKHLVCYILAYNNRSIYAWTKIEDAYLDGKVMCRKYNTNFPTIDLLHPVNDSMSFVTLSDEFFEPMSEAQWALSLYATNNFNFNVKNRYDRKTKDDVGVDLYLRAGLDHTNDKWYIDDILLKHKEYLDAKQVMVDYIDSYYSNTIDIYLTHILLKANILTPMFLNSSIDLQSYRVPRETYWIFQLLYGRDHHVYYQVDEDTKISFLDIKKRKRSKRIFKKDYSVSRIIIETNSNNIRPIVIHNNLAMRFQNEPIRR